MIVGMRLDLPTDPAMVPVVRRQVDALLRHMSVVDDDIYRADVVVTEACSNAVRHAYCESGNRYWVEIEYHTDRLVLRVTDRGSGFDLFAVPKPEPGQIGGYGLYFIHESADEVEVISHPQKGTMVVAVINVSYRDDRALSDAASLEHGASPTPGP